MKVNYGKIIFYGILPFVCITSSTAIHRARQNANNINSGILNPERIDVSSVTCLGPGPFSGSTIGTDVIVSTNIRDASINGIDIAAGTVGGTQTVRGIQGGVLPDNTGVVGTTHTIPGSLLWDDIGVVGTTHTIPGSFLWDDAGVIGTTHTIPGSFLWDDLGVVYTSHTAGGEILADGTGVLFSSHVGQGQIVISSYNVVFSSHISAVSGSLHDSTTSLRTAINATANFFATTTVRIDALGTDTTTLRSNVNGATNTLRTDVNAFNVFNTTGDQTLDELETATSTIRTELTALHSDTGTFRTSVVNATTTLRTDLNSAQNAISTTTDQIEGALQGTAVWFASNTARGFSGGIVENSAGVITSTMLASGVIPTNTNNRIYGIYIGSLNAISSEVDIASDTLDGLNEALRRLGAMGLTTSNTAYGTIFLKEGTYNWAGGTIPAGIRVYAVARSSTVLKLAANGDMILSVYGGLYGPLIDADDRPFTNTLIDLRSGARVENVRLKGAESMSLSARAIVFRQQDSTDVVLNVYAREFRAGTEQGSGWSGLYVCTRGSHSIVTFDGDDMTGTNAGDKVMAVQSCRDIHFQDGRYLNMSAMLLQIDGGSRDIFFERNQVLITGQYQVGGFLQVRADNIGVISTGVVINDNSFYHDSTDTDEIIGILNAANTTSGVILSNNFYRSMAGTDAPFCEVASGFGTVLRDNTIEAVRMLVDAGTQTRSASLGNFIANNEQ